MGKMYLIIVVGAMFTSGLLLQTGVQEDVKRADEHLGAYAGSQIARDIALTGLREAETRLTMQNYTSGTFEGTYEGGTYYVEVAPAGANMVTVHAEGTYRLAGSTTASHDMASHEIEVTYEHDIEESSATVPGAFEYAAASEGPMTFNGNSKVLPPGYDPESDAFTTYEPSNANVHSNETITVNSSNARIYGFGTFSDQSDAYTGGSEAMSQFSPPLDNGVENTYREVEQLDIPTFTANDYWDLADVQYTRNKQYKSETIAGGTREDPRIIYIGGRLDIKNNVSIDGHVIFIAEGDMRVTSFSNSGPEQESRVAFYTQQEFRANGGGGTVIEGQILADRAVLNGSSELYGSVASSGNLTVGDLTFNGGDNIYRREPSAALTAPLCEATGGTGAFCGKIDNGWNQIAYREAASRE